jgi:hypothetical protein
MNQALRQELLALVEQDHALVGAPDHDPNSDQVQRQRLELLGRLRRRLVQILDTYGWPGKRLVGEDGAEAAWLLALHTMPDPQVLRRCLRLLEAAAAAAGEAEPWQVAFLVDRVSLVERNVQVVGTTICRQADGSFGPALAGGSRAGGCAPSGGRASSAGARHPQDRTVLQRQLARLGLSSGLILRWNRPGIWAGRTGARPGGLGGRCAMAGPATLRPPPPCPPRWHRMLAVAVLLAATGCSGAADSPSSSRSTQPPPAPTSATVPTFDRSRFAAVIPLPGAASMTLADGMLWVRKGAGTVVRVDPATNQVVGKPLRVPADAEAIAVDDGALWVARVAAGDLGAAGKDQVSRIDLATGRTVATITVGRAPLDLAATPRAVWVTNAAAAATAWPGSTRTPTGWRVGRSEPAPAPRAWPWGASRCGSPTTTPAR